MIIKHRLWTSTGVLLLLLGLWGCSQPEVSQDAPAPSSTDAVLESSADPEQIASIVLVSGDVGQQVWQYLADEREKLGVCADEMNMEVSQSQSQVYQVGEQKYLVELLCFMAAYQGNYQYVLYESPPTGVKATLLQLRVFEPDNTGQLISREIDELGGLPTFDPATQMLTVFTKARGVGDCGSYGQYQWTGAGFQLTQYRVKLECDGQYVDPENYPQIYPEG